MLHTRRTYFLGLSLAMAVFWSAFLPFQSFSPQAAERNSLTREAKLAVFDDVWSTINQRYYDRNFQGLDWEAQRAPFRDLAERAGSTPELYSVLRRMIAALNDSHTRIYAPEEKFDWWRPRFITIGISVNEIGGLPVVVQVDRGSAPHRAGVRVGDVVERVDGRPALSLINRRQVNGAEPIRGPSRLRAFASLMEGLPASIVELSWRTRDDKVKTASFHRYWKERELGVRIRRNGSVAVVEMDGFTRPIAAALASSLKKELRGARAIVLDFRRNGGGDAEAMIDVASVFLGNGLSLGHFTDRFGSSYAIATRTKSPFISRAIEQTSVPVIVLASERTSSAAEIFIAVFKATGRARIVGGETCGCVLAIRHRHSLPDGGLLDVSEMDYQTPSGQRLEKQGVKPDRAVPVERTDLYDDRDSAMEIALGELKRRATLN